MQGERHFCPAVLLHCASPVIKQHTLHCCRLQFLQFIKDYKAMEVAEKSRAAEAQIEATAANQAARLAGRIDAGKASPYDLFVAAYQGNQPAFLVWRGMSDEEQAQWAAKAEVSGQELVGGGGGGGGGECRSAGGVGGGRAGQH